MKTCELWDMIPPEERELKMSYGNVELSADFMCFEEPYKAVAEFLPRNYTVIDLGCNQAAQCYYFKDYEQYIGVDGFDKNYDVGWVPPLRFMCPNTEHYVEDVENFLDTMLRIEETMPRNAYFIVSALPHFKTEYLDEYGIDNYLWWYPNLKPKAKGIQDDNILRRLNGLLAEKEREWKDG